MAMGRRIGGDRLPDWADTARSGGQVLDSGPYVGVVKNNLDPTRSGRLQVYIPNLGGDEDEVQNWRTVGYASPYGGSTFQPEKSNINSHDRVHHTYGMWAVPPDIGNEVLCTFVGGDPGQGYWFACVNSHLSHNQLPATGNFGIPDKDTVVSTLVKNSLNRGGILPSGEFNENIPGYVSDQYLTVPRTVHEYQAEITINQGLDLDKTRGAISSSSQRETPSQVFGISTPGRPTADPTLDPDYVERLNEGRITEEDYAIRQRRGGHSFVMDDGDINGKDQLVRIRSSAGHQILMSDDNKFIQIINGNGSVWMEMTGDGHLMMYSYGGIHFRTEGEMNFHADSNINFNAGGKVNVHAKGDINFDSANNLTSKANGTMLNYAGTVKVGSGGDIVMHAASKIDVTATGNLNLWGSRTDLNSGAGPSLSNPGSLKKFFHTDVTRPALAEPWNEKPRSTISINSIVPAHEPWTRQTGEAVTDTSFVVGQNLEAAAATRLASLATGFAETGGTIAGGYAGPTTAVRQTSTASSSAGGFSQPIGGPDTSGKPITGTVPTGAGAGNNSGPDTAKGQPIKNSITKADLSRPDAPPVTKAIPPLSAEQAQALKTQIAKSESGFDYSATNQFNYLGRYQVGGAVLQDQGLLRPEYVKKYGNRAAQHPEAWTAKAHSMGITSQADFLNNGAVQEQVMDNLLVSNAKIMSRIGALRKDDDPATAAGMLQTAHLLGAGGAKNWRNGAGGADANGTTGIAYFNKGRGAIETLSA